MDIYYLSNIYQCVLIRGVHLHMRTYTQAGCIPYHTTGTDAEYPIPESLIGFYVEHIVCNYTGETIWYMNSVGGKPLMIPHTSGGSLVIDKHVKIIHRRVSGSRTRDKGKFQGQAWKDEINIDLNVLRDTPIFIPEMAITVASARHEAMMVNPASPIYREALIRDLYEKLGKEVVRSPVAIIANDPTNTYTNLYTIVNGEIVGVKVSHFQGEDETDGISLIRRNLSCTIELNDVHIARTSFADLKRMPEMTWVIDGYRITPHVHRLEDWLKQTTPIVNPNIILIDEHKKIIADNENRYNEASERLLEDVKILKELDITNKREIALWKKQAEQASSADYAEKSHLILEKELELKQLKTAHEVLALQYKDSEDSAKRKEEALKRQHDWALRQLEMKTSKQKSLGENFKTVSTTIGGVAVIIGGIATILKLVMPLFKQAAVAT